MIYLFDRRNAPEDNPQGPLKIRQPPKSIPYIVDNLWEWRRPDKFPSRHYSVFASPSMEMAAESGGSDDGCVFEVELDESAVVAQLDVADARHHRDCRSLIRLMHVFLGPKWFDQDADAKYALGRLYIPCLTKEEVEDVMREQQLSKHREELWDTITFWENALLVTPGDEPPDNKGEIFFQADRWSLSSPL